MGPYRTALMGFIVVFLGFLSACPGTIHPEKEDVDEFTRQDGTKVYCLRVPVEIVNKSTKANVSVTIKNIGKWVEANGGVEIAPEKITPTSVSLNDYRVIARQLCLQYVNGIYTKDQYRVIQEKILPAVEKKAQPTPMVDSEIEVGEPVALGNIKRVPLTMRIFPATENNLEVVNVIFALMTVKDEAKLPAGYTAKVTTKTCAEVSSCLKANLWDQRDRPIIVRGGKEQSARLNWSVDVKKDVKAIHVFCETYQREADDGNRCVVDSSKPGPAGGVPYLKVVNGSGKTVAKQKCYRSSSEKLIKL